MVDATEAEATAPPFDDERDVDPFVDVLSDLDKQDTDSLVSKRKWTIEAMAWIGFCSLSPFTVYLTYAPVRCYIHYYYLLLSFSPLLPLSVHTSQQNSMAINNNKFHKYRKFFHK